MERPYRARRSCLAVPASSERFIEKARGLAADEVFLDLEDAVAPAAKAQARANAAAAVAGDWGGRVLAVRANDATTPWAHRDVIDVVHPRLDVVVLPKVTSADHVAWLDLLLGQVEREAGLPPGRIGIDAQIEDAAGLGAVNAIAAASPRLEALVFGPADFMASVGIRSLDVGGQPAGYAGGDVYHYPLMRILVAARARGLQAIDGPYLKVRDVDGFRRSAASAAALGYDGKWVLHPDQIDAANEVFAPSATEFERASRIIEAYEHATGVEARGAVMLGDEMIDEASHKMAWAIVAKGRAAGMPSQWVPGIAVRSRLHPPPGARRSRSRVGTTAVRVGESASYSGRRRGGKPACFRETKAAGEFTL
jgi:citrate lyase subunit beta / citryl-CoA lyase